MLKNRINWLLGMVLAALLVGCSAPEDAIHIPPQKWGETVVEVQTRAAPIGGVYEFLVLTTLERGKPVSDLIVSLRGSEEHAWKQAIQDGLSGVYRTAVPIPGGATEVQIKLRRKRTEEEAVLTFPLTF